MRNFIQRKLWNNPYFLVLNSSCEITMPAKISTQPKTAVNDIVSPNKSIQPTAQKTDSNENMMADSVGPEFFCPIICKV